MKDLLRNSTLTKSWSDRLTHLPQVSNRPTGFGHGPAPQRRMRRRLALTRKDVYVLLVAEPYTSQRCDSCRGQFEAVCARLKRRQRKPKRLREPAPDDVHLSGNRRRDVIGVRRCQTNRSTGGEPKHWHRDANAARNILEAGQARLRGESRPAYLPKEGGRREDVNTSASPGVLTTGSPFCIHRKLRRAFRYRTVCEVVL